MSIQDKIEVNELLLIQYIRNELTNEERIQVEEWINASEENKKIIEDCYYLSWAISTLQTIKNTSATDALQKVDRRIKKNKSRIFIRRVPMIAALLALSTLILSTYLFIQSREKNSAFYLEAKMTPGMVGSMVLPDGTKVWLNSSTYIKYPSSFEGKTREITLDGEAYFKVEKDQEKRFIVHTEQSSIAVLGTEFNVDAYSTNGFITTTLVNGSVEFNYITEYEKAKSIQMQPNEQIFFNKETHKAEKKETYLPKDIAWMKGQIVLRDTPLSEVLWILNKRFNVEFVIKDPSFYKHSFTGVFTNQQIERVLEHFHRSSDIRYKIDHLYDDDGEIVKSRVELF